MCTKQAWSHIKRCKQHNSRRLLARLGNCFHSLHACVLARAVYVRVVFYLQCICNVSRLVIQLYLLTTEIGLNVSYYNRASVCFYVCIFACYATHPRRFASRVTNLQGSSTTPRLDRHCFFSPKFTALVHFYEQSNCTLYIKYITYNCPQCYVNNCSQRHSSNCLRLSPSYVT